MSDSLGSAVILQYQDCLVAVGSCLQSKVGAFGREEARAQAADSMNGIVMKSFYFMLMIFSSWPGGIRSFLTLDAQEGSKKKKWCLGHLGVWRGGHGLIESLAMMHAGPP